MKKSIITLHDGPPTCQTLCVFTKMARENKQLLSVLDLSTRVVPKVMSNSFLHANWEQQTKESAVVDGTSCCVVLECHVTSIACIT